MLMDHSVLSGIDLAIIAVYLIAMISIGLHFVKRIKGSEDYYVAGRSFGPLILMATVCATIIGGSGLMGRAGKAYSFGTMAITTALPYLIGMFIFSGISGRISRVGTKFDITSMPELFEQRFGKTAKIILACMVAFTMMGTVASQVTATATILPPEIAMYSPSRMEKPSTWASRTARVISPSTTPLAARSALLSRV